LKIALFSPFFPGKESAFSYFSVVATVENPKSKAEAGLTHPHHRNKISGAAPEITFSTVSAFNALEKIFLGKHTTNSHVCVAI